MTHVLFFIALGSRRVHLAGCTATPDAAWVTQQARRFAWHLQDGEPGAVKFLVHDRDDILAAPFDTLFGAEGIEVLRTPPQASNAHAHAERWVRAAREECLDRLLVLHERHLTFVLKRYLEYYNHWRPHQGLAQRIPGSAVPPPPAPIAPGQVRRQPVLGGIIHDYQLAA